MDGKPDAGIGQARTDQRAKKRPAAERGMELRHDGAPQFVLDVGPFNVLGHVPQPDAHAEEEQGDGGSGDRFGQEGQCDADSGHRRHEPGTANGVGGPDPAHHQAGGRQGDKRAEGHA